MSGKIILRIMKTILRIMKTILRIMKTILRIVMLEKDFPASVPQIVVQARPNDLALRRTWRAFRPTPLLVNRKEAAP